MALVDSFCHNQKKCGNERVKTLYSGLSKSNVKDHYGDADSMGLPLANLTQLSQKSAVLCEITRSDDHWAVQGHSRSPILVPIESPYTTSYQSINNVLNNRGPGGK